MGTCTPVGRLSQAVHGCCCSAGSVAVLRGAGFHPLCSHPLEDGRLLVEHPLAPLCQSKPAHSLSCFSHHLSALASLPPDPFRFLHIPLEQGPHNGTPFQLCPCLQQAELELQTTLPNVAQFPISAHSQSECGVGSCLPGHPLYAQVLSTGLTTPGSIWHLSLLNLPSPCQAHGSPLPFPSRFR